MVMSLIQGVFEGDVSECGVSAENSVEHGDVSGVQKAVLCRCAGEGAQAT